MTERSIQVPTFQAAMTPKGMAKHSVTMSVITVSAAVGSRRWAMSSVTGRLVKIEMPRSPCSTPQAQVPKRTKNGSSRPSC